MTTVYTLPACVQCESTKKYLTKMGVLFNVVDMTEDSTSMDFVKALGYQSAPVVVSGDKHWSGFRPELLSALASN